MVAVYHAELAEAQADPALAALFARGPESAPFDRLDWLHLLAVDCLAVQDCFIAVAREGEALAALPLRRTPGGLAAIANWYSFTARPLCNDPERAPALLAALAEDLARHGAIGFGPLPEADAAALARAFRAGGWIVRAEPCDSNHVLPVEGRSFADYWATRPGALRETVRRKGRKGTVALSIATAFDPAEWADYEAVYAQSWKPDEGSPAFLRRFAEAEGAAGALRLGIARIDGRAVAAQFWTVEGGTAFIHKLAHDEAARAHSPGTLLTAAMFAHVIDRDRVSLVDFGSGDDPYKRDWMDAVRPRWRLEAYRPAAVRHWKGLARLAARRLLRPADALALGRAAS